MRSKKTIEVSKLLHWANAQLVRMDGRATVEWKAGICSIIEQVLHDTGNYKGFGFYSNADSETGTLGFYTRSYYVSDKIKEEYIKL
jgi:hypothetical protein